MKILFILLSIIIGYSSANAQTTRRIQSSDVTGALGYTPIQSIGGMTGVISCGTGVTCASQVITSSHSVDQITGLGSGVATALGVNVGLTGAVVVQNGALGTPTSGIATNLTGVASGLTAGVASAVPVGGITGAGTGCVTWLTTPTSANLRGCLTDETGTGSVYFQSGDLGTPTAGILTNATGLPLAGLVSGSQDTVLGYWSSTAVTAATIPNCAGALIYSTGTHTFSCNVSAGTGTVTQVVCGTGLTGGTITATGTCAVSLTNLTNSLGADVAMNNTANYFDGPSVAQGTSGSWFASGTVTVQDTAGNSAISCKLWDGTTVIASTRQVQAGASNPFSLSMSGTITSPAANIRISCKDVSSTSGQIVFNTSGSSKDSTVAVMRIQ